MGVEHEFSSPPGNPGFPAQVGSGGWVIWYWLCPLVVTTIDRYRSCPTNDLVFVFFSGLDGWVISGGVGHDWPATTCAFTHCAGRLPVLARCTRHPSHHRRLHSHALGRSDAPNCLALWRFYLCRGLHYGHFVRLAGWGHRLKIKPHDSGVDHG